MVVNVNYASNLKNQLHTYYLIIFLKVLKKLVVTTFGKRLPINNKCQSMSIPLQWKKYLKCIYYLHILDMVHWWKKSQEFTFKLLKML